MNIAERVLQRAPQLEFDNASGNICWNKNFVTRWNDAIGVEWATMRAAIEKDE